MPTYTSQYPPAHSDIYVKSTTKYGVDYWAFFATDPALSLIGTHVGTSWVSVNLVNTNQRFHIDLGSSKAIRRIYYENFHISGIDTDIGVKNFTFWGSNIGPGTFDDLVYGNDDGWNILAVSQNTFDIHISADQADPKYIVVDNPIVYRYYACKFADNYTHVGFMGLRHMALQTEDGYIPPPPPIKEASRTGIYTFKTLKI